MPLIVNGQAIDDSALEAEFSNIKAYFEGLGNVSCCERDAEFHGYARQNVIARVLLAEEALRRAAPPAPEAVEAALERVKEDHGGEQQFNAMIAFQPGQLEQIRRDVEVNLRVRSMIEALCAGLPEPTDDELRACYDRHAAAYTAPEQVRASHISKDQGRGEARPKAYEALRDVRRQLLAGADFDEMARLHSDKGHEQVDLGFFKRGEYPEEFELVAFSMEVGELSPVFASQHGYHIAKLTARTPASIRPFEDVRDEVRHQFLDERGQEKTKQLVADLQSRATIEQANDPGPESAEVEAEDLMKVNNEA